ncbi:unnamed protein product [Polarella glacialis]|uniref:Uncharacterized protein n=1 Tax=Polarella glacialis TaxID=89957 RepID=A0A813I2X0_POLGL|nr:unnamed protein product [Polarella glacialis]
MAGAVKRWAVHLQPRTAGASVLLSSVGIRPGAWHGMRLLSSQRSVAAEQARLGQVEGLTAHLKVRLLQSECPAPVSDSCAPGLVDLDELERRIADARKTAKTFGNATGRSPTRKATVDGKWLCFGCQNHLPAYDFYPGPQNSKIPVRSKCVVCEKRELFAFHRSLRGNALRLLWSAQARSKDRSHSCTLMFDDILDMLWDQKGRCAYSGVVIEVLLPNSHWRWSLERKSNLAGYSIENCLLIAAEFNTSDYSLRPGVVTANVLGTAQWSAEKVLYVSGARFLNVDLTRLAADVNLACCPPRTPHKPHERRIANSDGDSLCTKCSLYKPAEEFNQQTKSPLGLCSYCRVCSNENSRRHRTTLRGQVLNMMGLARRRSRVRQQAFSVEANDVFDMLRSQGGRCFYSEVPLQFQRLHADWRMSLENVIGAPRQLYWVHQGELCSHSY